MKKLNLAKVRSAIVAVTIALAALLAAAPAAPAKQQPTVTLAWITGGATVAELADSGLSPGLMSAGLGSVPALQTYLDVSQGNRVFDSLYDESLAEQEGYWGQWPAGIEERAESAPAEIVPRLLGKTLHEAGLGADLETVRVRSGGIPDLVARMRKGDLLIAISAPPPPENEQLAIGVAGQGFDGNLISDSTRIDGYVLSTDVAPTILDWLGVEVPSEMSGQPIHSEGSVDVAAIESLGERMSVISHRRGPVIGFSLLAWLLSLVLVAAASRGALARPAVRVVGLAVIYMPLTMLAGAAVEPGELAEVLLVMLGAPLLAALTLVLLSGYRGLAVAAGITVAAYALDLVLGSPLTSLSLLGPNPGLGVRFYGIGNELEALLAVLVVAGTGATLAGFWPRLRGGRAAAAFVVVGLLAAFLFAAGRFGADVGAAIVFPVGAAVAAVAIAGKRRRWGLLAVVAAPFAALAVLALIDLVSGANAHLTRSVLDAGGLGDLSDVVQRRLQLSANSFGRPVLLVFLPLVAALGAAAIVKRERLRAWVRDVPAVRAGLLGALAATLIGTLANDSGALLLEVGTAYLLVFTGFAWAESRPEPASPGV